ncbi:MAG: Fic family protein [bacterium]|nr:Fic family protein [bacterium]
MDKQQWIDSVLASLTGMSRTIGGVSDTTSSADKPKLGVEREALASRSEGNLRHMLDDLWVCRDYRFISAAEVREFVDGIAEDVNTGLLSRGQSLYRTWETKFGQTPVAAIEAEYSEFCGRLFAGFSEDDSVRVAAIVEKKLDGEIHPFADGCGRTAKVLAAFVLLRDNRTPPRYGSRTEYYGKINTEWREWFSYYRSLCEETPRMA